MPCSSRITKVNCCCEWSGILRAMSVLILTTQRWGNRNSANGVLQSECCFPQSPTREFFGYGARATCHKSPGPETPNARTTAGLEPALARVAQGRLKAAIQCGDC